MKKLLLFLLCSLPLRAQTTLDQAFEQAKREKKLVILELEAVWCHWCHVMAETTYKDPAVLARLNKSYVVVKVDQDSRPDLSRRYEDYGWPATIIFDRDRRELIKLSGYVNPKEMKKVLDGLAKDPRPRKDPEATDTPRPTRAAKFSPKLHRELEERHFDHYDDKLGGFGFTHKFLNWNSTEYCLTRADARSLRMARQTLNGELNLVDPVWGGVYQYSDGGIWTSPHFEKVMDHQSGNLRLFSLAFARFGEPKYRQAAGDVARFLQTFLTSPEGAFYTSMDADVVRGEHSGEYFAKSDAERRKIGIPRIDTHVYARENGWAIEALALHAASAQNAEAGQAALKAANWIVKHRRRPDGNYNHGENDPSGPYLGDQIAMGKAFLALYSLTAEPVWLQRAAQIDLGSFIQAKLPGFVSYQGGDLVNRDENIAAFRFANLLAHHTENPLHRRWADQALGYLAVPDVARQYNTGGVLLAEYESQHEPLAVSVVGPKADANCRRMFEVAQSVNTHYRKIEWWDPKEAGGGKPSAGFHYPAQPTGCTYVCADGRCSRPLKSEEEVLAYLKERGFH